MKELNESIRAGAPGARGGRGGVAVSFRPSEGLCCSPKDQKESIGSLASLFFIVWLFCYF